MRDTVTCPHCGDAFEANFEYGAGNYNVAKPNECLRCGSFEIPHRIEGSMPWQAQTGWEGPGAFECSIPSEFVLDMAERMYALGVQYGLKNAERAGNAPPESLAPAMRVG